MKEEFGYTQMLFNYITDYANSISEQAVRMEMAWHNRDCFSEEVDVEKWLDGQRKEMETSMESLKQYLKPLNKEK